MRAVCNTETLGRRLSLVSRGVATRSSVRIYSGVLFEAFGEEGTARLSAMDGEISIRGSTPAEVEEEGSVVIPARIFHEIVRSLPAGEISIERDPSGGAVMISSANNQYRIRTYEAEEFPALPEFSAERASVISGEVLVDTVEKVSRSYSRDETRPVLTGILTSFEDSKVRMVTTDSYRLSIMVADLGVSLGDSGTTEAIIPARAMQEVGRIFSSSDEENIEMILGENQAMFRIGDVVFTTTLIEGNFPEYGKLLPEGFEREISVSREDLIGTLRRVNLFTGRQSPQVPVSLSFSEGAVEVIVRSQEIGEARETLAADSEDEFYISFNPSYLMDGVSAIDAKNVVFRFNEPMKPGMILPEGKEGEFLYLIMPMRDPYQG